MRQINDGMLVLLLTPTQPHKHDHTAVLTKEGYRVQVHTHSEASVTEILRLDPAVVIAELGDEGRAGMFELVQRLKEHKLTRHIPLIVYGVGLTAGEIESTARAGAMWLQLEPRDGYKLLGAIRGV